MIERLVELRRGEPVGELVPGVSFKQLREADAMALAAEYRVKRSDLRARFDGRPSAKTRGFGGGEG
jgi:hypothetical protein